MDGVTLILKKIELKQFMCHNNFSISFNRPITCITGRNGSGKSAIMVAMGVIFGQTAQKLGRGRSFCELVKTGHSYATITLSLYNIYHIPGYEEEIVLEKKIHAKSTTSASLRIREGGKMVDFSMKRLRLLIRDLKLNLDNPLNFLTQDDSKRILSATSPSEMYDFYYRGTEFKLIEEEISEAEVKLEEMTHKISQANEKFTDLTKGISVAKNRLKFLSTDFDQLLRQLEWEERWMELKHKEKNIEKFTGDIRGLEGDILSYNEELNGLIGNTAIFAPINMSSINTTLDAKEIEFRSVNSDFMEIERDFDEKRNNLESSKARNNKERLEIKITELEEQEGEIENKVKELTMKQQEIDPDYQAESEKNRKQDEMRRNFETQLRVLQRDKASSYAEAVMKKFEFVESQIKRAHFKDKIIGPLCKYIKLKEQKWYKPTSIILRKTLESFIVFNSEDKNTFFNIFKNSSGKFSVFQLSSKKLIEPSYLSDYTTLLGVLELKEPIIANLLITMHNAEELVLIEERKQAYLAVERDKRINSAYIKTGDRIKMVGGRLSDYRDRDSGNYFFENANDKIEEIKEKLGKIEIVRTFTQKRREIEDEKETVSKELYLVQKQLREKRIELKSYENVKDEDLDKLKRKLVVLNKQMDNLKSKKNKLEDELNEIQSKKAEMEKENIQRRLNCKKLEENKRSRVQKLEAQSAYARDLKEQKVAAKNALISSVDAERTKLLTEGSKEMEHRSKSAINEERAKLKALMLQAEELGNKQKYEEEIKALKENQKTTNKLLKKFKNSIEATSNAIEERKAKRDEIKGIKTQEAIKTFKELTAISNYEGELIFDHKKKLLDLKMKVHNNTIKGNKHTLSGGERSFAGVCFLLSLWKSFTCPLKIMDEFDVFMDSVNRKNSIRSIFEFVKEEKMQAILITPLDVADMVDEVCEIKKIKKLND